jgi:CheY-like chemotaxis protein
VLLAAEPSVQVEESPDGLHALHALATWPAQVLVADRGLPSITGIELIRRARAAGLASEALLVTGFPSPETVLEAIEVGACGFFVKPIDDAEALRGCLRAALDRDADRQRVAGLGPLLRPWAVRALAAARLAAAPQPVLDALSLLSHRHEGPARVGVVAERALVGPLALEGHRAEGPWEVDRALASLDEVEAVVLGEGLDLDEAFDVARRVLATPSAPALLWALPTGSFEETLALLGNRTTGIIRRPLDYAALGRAVTRAVETRRSERRALALRTVLDGLAL